MITPEGKRQKAKGKWQKSTAAFATYGRGLAAAGQSFYAVNPVAFALASEAPPSGKHSFCLLPFAFCLLPLRGAL